MLKARRRALGRPQFGGVTNSDDWFSKDGNDGVGKSYSSFVPSHHNEKSIFFSDNYMNRLSFLQGLFRMQNLRFAYFLNCDSLISCAAHNK
jgi:hypothetical protein